MEILQVALGHPPRPVTSGGAEAATGLSRALRALGHETMVVVPHHPDYGAAGLLAAKRLSPLALSGGERVDVFEAQLPSGIHLVLLDVPGAASVVESDQELSHDDAVAVGSFGRAVAAYVQELASMGRCPDVVHAHGALSGLCLLGLDEAQVNVPAKVLSVHDARESGKVAASEAEALGIPPSLATAHAFGMGQQLCLLKGLLGLADRVVVPSVAYARSLCSPERLGALARAFSAVEPVGIFLGVDVAVFNPATDSSLAARFDAADPSPKGLCKSALQQALELEFGAERPLLLVETEDGGEAQAVISTLPALVRQDVQLMVCVPRPVSPEERELLAPFRGQVKVVSGLSHSERRRALSGADFYLSVRKSDPSGLSLRQAMRYGAIPLALEVDSVSDHVIDCDAEFVSGTGFLLESVTQRAITSGVGRCVTAFRSKLFDDLRRRVMRRDVSWDRPSRQMLQLYSKLTTHQR